MTKWFIDCNSVIRPIFSGDGSSGWVMSSDENGSVYVKDRTVYVVNYEGCVIGEYTLWDSLTELAMAIEG